MINSRNFESQCDELTYQLKSPSTAYQIKDTRFVTRQCGCTKTLWIYLHHGDTQEFLTRLVANHHFGNALRDFCLGVSPRKADRFTSCRKNSS